MSIRVGQLVHELRSKSRVVSTKMGRVSLVVGDSDNPTTLRVGDEQFAWGDRNTQVVTQFVKGPGYKYLLGQPLDWQRQVIQHHVTTMADADTLWYIEGSAIAGIYYPDTKIIPLVDVAERVANVFDMDDEATILYAPDQVEIDVLSRAKAVTVPGIPGVESRPMEGSLERNGIAIGDISEGGIRIIIHPSKPERAPEVHELWKRYVCTNGMTRKVAGSQIKLRGRTVPEILNEVENVARGIFEGLEGSGRAILHSAETPVPGATSDFIRQVAREHRINADTILRLQERGAELPTNPTVYDVTQIITAMANQENVPALTRRALQAIGGDLTIDTDRMVHRCTQCERPLVAA
jgi:hypothetical protein